MKNKGLVITLRIAGVATIIIGVILMGFMVYEFSQAGPWVSKGELKPVELAMAAGVGFYHFVIGLLCFGVAQAMGSSNQQVKVHASQ